MRIRAGDRGALKEDHQILSSSEEESVEPGGKDGNQESSPLYLRDVQAARVSKHVMGMQGCISH